MNFNNLSLYSAFITVVEEGNISAAAQKLYISQPAISKSIKKLENNLGISLFNRNSRGVALTEEGALLYRHVKSAFEDIDAGEENIQLHSKLGIGHIRLGVSTTLCKYLLLPFLKPFVEQNPHISISIECQSSGRTTELIENGKIDIGLIARPAKDNGLSYLSLGHVRDSFIATEEYLQNLHLREDVDLTEEPKYANIMMLDKNNVSRMYADRYIPAEVYSNNSLIEVNSMDLIIEFAKTGLGIGCVIMDFVKKELENSELTEVKFKNIKIPKREVCFAHSAEISQSAQTFMDYVSKCIDDNTINILKD